MLGDLGMEPSHVCGPDGEELFGPQSLLHLFFKVVVR